MRNTNLAAYKYDSFNLVVIGQVVTFDLAFYRKEAFDLSASGMDAS